MLHDYGGTIGMFGKVENVIDGPHASRLECPDAMVGIGITPEGIHNSYPMYDLMLENGWRSEPVPNMERSLETKANCSNLA